MSRYERTDGSASGQPVEREGCATPSVPRLAHEVRNPLSTVKVNLKLIAENLESESPDLPAAVHKVRIVLAETERIERILNDFIAYQDDLSGSFASLDLAALIAEAVEFYKPKAAENGIAVRVDLPDSPLYCSGEPGMLKQVMLNLFINAQHAMPDGGELFAGLHRDDGKAVIRIVDTGCGVAPEIQKKIFEPYYSTRTDGCGLGLAIARKIIRGHGGEITVESEPGKGTLFTITLPIETQR